ncbi:tRNA (guanosine(46)-N7)-methyltransferase TrmB [Sediminitomix flava]|uniref:tRNA (guanine-N(7)-)-methyltransferase n=1 Tax=Sediminitomix flava TaxID=379075 RepID=A0A315ZIP6_SEDFL|nr:tRNA (guanosine(46)-N7)-methyltransferase TrmB [Sediminitomix flava]PWJ44970.1 tRNA (guanine-N(7)-)-methyltransferase [Sediminitomix flava]
MARQKQKKFAVTQQRDYIVEPGKEIYESIRGQWREKIFKNDNPIVLELACGRGEYSTGLGEVYPDKNFIGIDIKGDRLWYGSNVVEEKGLKNVAFLRCFILDLEKFFADGEVDEIWIVHPDPRPRKGDAKKRLTHPRFLNNYRKILKDNGLVRFKTDNQGLFEYTLEVLEEEKIPTEVQTFNLYEEPELMKEHHGIKTRYERKFTAEGHNIHYCRFRLHKKDITDKYPVHNPLLSNIASN